MFGYSGLVCRWCTFQQHGKAVPGICPSFHETAKALKFKIAALLWDEPLKRCELLLMSVHSVCECRRAKPTHNITGLFRTIRMQTGRPKARRLPAISGLTTRSDITRTGESGCRPGRRSIHPRSSGHAKRPGQRPSTTRPPMRLWRLMYAIKQLVRRLGLPPNWGSAQHRRIRCSLHPCAMFSWLPRRAPAVAQTS